MTIEALIARFGIFAVFVGAAVEGETAVATGGLFAHRGLLALPLVIAAAAAGSFLADQVFFLVGRHYRHHPRLTRWTAKPAFARALRSIARHPTGFILVFRFLWGLRTVSPIAIGTTGIGWRRFAALNALAALLWASLVSMVGYSLAATLAGLGARLERVPHYLVAIVGLALFFAALGWWLRRRWRLSR